MVKMELKGLSQLQHALRELPKRMSRKVLEKGMIAGAAPMARSAKERVPVLAEATPYRKPGTIRKRISAKRAKPLAGMTATVNVAVRGPSRAAVRNFKIKQLGKKVSKGRAGVAGVSAANNPDDPFYWKFVEKGTSKMRAQPFMRPAFDANKEQSAKLSADQFKVEIARAAAELRRTGQ